MNPRVKDLTGQTYGWLEVVRFSGTENFKGGSRRMWECRCRCGKLCVISSNSLQQKNTRSCGCLSRASAKLNPRRKSLPEGESSFNWLCSSYRNAAKSRGRTFNLTPEQMRTLFKGNCHYCGKPPSQRSKNQTCRAPFYYNGIDRIINSRGYEPENVVSCCKMCNFVKARFGYFEIINWATRVAKRVKTVTQADMDIALMVLEEKQIKESMDRALERMEALQVQIRGIAAEGIVN